MKLASVKCATTNMVSDSGTSTRPSWRSHTVKLRAALRHDLLSFCGHTSQITRTTSHLEREPLHRIVADPTAPSYVRRRASRLLDRR